MAWPRGLSGNLPIDQLSKQMARGAASGAAPGSAGNIMPGPSAVRGPPARMTSGGATGGTAGNPMRGGAPPMAKGRYQQIAGSPNPGAPVTPATIKAPTPGSVRSHSLALGGLKHMMAAGHISAADGARMANTSRAHIDSYNKAKPKAPPKMKFGSLGGMGGNGSGPGAGLAGGLGSSLGPAASGAGGLGGGGSIPSTPGGGGSPFDMD